MLDWDESFSMQANLTNSGYQSIVLKGFITEQRSDGLYAAPLLPQLFYGADGSQLTTWRQYLDSSGSQTILSRSGGLPEIPKEELYWKKIRDTTEVKEQIPTPTPAKISLGQIGILLSILVGGLLLFGSRGK